MTEHRRALSGDWYTDPSIFAEELDRVFAHTWQLVGHAGQLTRAGDFLTAAIGDQGVAVIRQADGSLHAMYNVCQHRGHELLVGDAGSAQSITCPYHAWTYDLDGRLLFARGEQVGDLCVPAVRLEEMAGFLWVNLDDGAGIAQGLFLGHLFHRQDRPHRNIQLVADVHDLEFGFGHGPFLDGAENLVEPRQTAIRRRVIGIVLPFGLAD